MSGAAANWPTVELREIHVFLTLAEELHFARTAERLGLTHSRVSQIIRGLETQVGGRLFDRTSRRVRLTPVGEQLRGDLGEPYRQLERALANAREAAIGVAGPLRIGIYARVSCGPHWLPITRAFKARYPACAVVLVDTKFDHNPLDVLRAGEIDMAATRLPISDDDVTVGSVLSQEDRVLLVAKDDPLAKRETVRLEDFADRVVSDAPALPREMIDAWCPPVTPSGRRFRRKDIRSFEDCLMLVAAGELVHPTVASFLDYYVHDGVVAVPISDLPPSQTGLVWLSGNRSAKVAAFAQCAADVLAQTEPDPHVSVATRARSAGVAG
jgi:DNA-binding transcriptional LysR family regulator